MKPIGSLHGRTGQSKLHCTGKRVRGERKEKLDLPPGLSPEILQEAAPMLWAALEHIGKVGDKRARVLAHAAQRRAWHAQLIANERKT